MGRLERTPGGPDNWVERVGGLPPYIEMVAVHLHEQEGFTISHAIATAVNTVKRWARKGTVVKYNDPKNNHVTVITAAKAAADVALWETKKAMARAGAGGTRRGRLSLSSNHTVREGQVQIGALAERANAIADPVARGEARLAVIDLAALTKDGRKSYKHQGKWKHGFIPVDPQAKTSKAKGSPIAAKRINRLYGSPSKQAIKSKEAERRTLAARAAKGAAHGQRLRSTTGAKGGGQQERVQTAGQSLHADIRDSSRTQRQVFHQKSLKEVGKGPRGNSRATKAWNQIPASQKTTRGGKRYVVSFFKGKNLLTEWVGNNEAAAPTDPGKRIYGSIRQQDLQKMSTGTLRKLARSSRNSKSIRSMARAVLDAKQKKNRRTA